MSVQKRAEQDVLNGDFALARQRLEAHLNARGYDQVTLKRLAEISTLMHDPFSAGRFFLASAAEGAEVEQAVETFRARAGSSRQQVLTHLPAAVRGMSFANFPLAAQKRLRQMGLEGAFPVVLPRRPRRRARTAGPLGHAVFVLILLFTVGSCSIGVKQMVGWLAE